MVKVLTRYGIQRMMPNKKSTSSATNTQTVMRSSENASTRSSKGGGELTMEQRVAALEKEVEELKKLVENIKK